MSWNCVELYKIPSLLNKVWWNCSIGTSGVAVNLDRFVMLKWGTFLGSKEFARLLNTSNAQIAHLSTSFFLAHPVQTLWLHWVISAEKIFKLHNEIASSGYSYHITTCTLFCLVDETELDRVDGWDGVQVQGDGGKHEAVHAGGELHQGGVLGDDQLPVHVNLVHRGQHHDLKLYK